MIDGNVVDRALGYETAQVEAVSQYQSALARLRDLPWTTIMTDAALLAAMILVSSKLFIP